MEEKKAIKSMRSVKTSMFLRESVGAAIFYLVFWLIIYLIKGNISDFNGIKVVEGIGFGLVMGAIHLFFSNYALERIGFTEFTEGMFDSKQSFTLEKNELGLDQLKKRLEGDKRFKWKRLDLSSDGLVGVTKWDWDFGAQTVRITLDYERYFIESTSSKSSWQKGYGIGNYANIQWIKEHILAGPLTGEK